MSEYGRGITTRKHEIDTTDVASVEASIKKIILEDAVADVILIQIVLLVINGP